MIKKYPRFTAVILAFFIFFLPGKAFAQIFSNEMPVLQAKERWTESFDRKIQQEINALQRAKEKQAREKSGGLYQEAVSAYKVEDYDKAEELFNEVQRLSPGYRRTERYLADIDRRISRAGGSDPARVRGNFFETGISGERARTDGFVPVEADAVIQKIVEERNRQFRQEAEDKYRQALELYKQQNYFEAKVRFIQVEALIPNYKKTLDYLGRIDQDIARQQAEREQQTGSVQIMKPVPPLIVIPREADDEVENNYRRAVELYRRKNFTEAKAQFAGLQTDYPDYKNIRGYLIRIDRKLARQQERLRKKAAAEARTAAKAEFQEKEARSSAPFDSVSDGEVALEPGREVEEVKKDKRKEAGDERRAAVRDLARLKKQAEDLELPEWELRRDRKYAELRAKEQHLQTLKGARYKEFRKQIDEEYRRLDEVEKERRRRIARQEAVVKDRLAAEDKDRRREELERERQARLKEKTERRAAFEAEQEALREQQEKERIESARVRDEQRAAEQKKAELEKERDRAEHGFQEDLDLLRARIDRIQHEFDEKIALKNQEIGRLKNIIESKDRQAVEVISGRETRREKVAAQARSDDDPAVETAARKAASEVADEIKRDDALEQIVKVSNEQERLEKRKAAVLRRQRAEIKAYLARLDAGQRARIKQEVSPLYLEGVALYADKRYLASKIKFNAVENLYPGYRNTRAYITRIDKLMAHERKRYERELVAKKVEEKKAELYETDRDARIEPVKDQIEKRVDQKVLKKIEKLKRTSKKNEGDGNKARSEEDDDGKLHGSGTENLALAKDAASAEKQNSAEKKEGESRQEAAAEVKKDKTSELALLERQKKAEMEKQRRQETRNQKARQREAVRLARQREREEMLKQRRTQKQLQADIDRVAAEALEFYAKGESSPATEKFMEFDRLLAGGGFSDSYVRGRRARLVRDKDKIERRLAREKTAEMNFVQKEKTSFEDGSGDAAALASAEAVALPEVDVEGSPELKVLQEKIKVDEKRLSRQRAVQDSRLREAKEREAELARREELRERLRQKRLEKQREREEAQKRLEQAKRERIEFLEQQRSQTKAASEETPVAGAPALVADEPSRQDLEDLDRQRRMRVSPEQRAMEKRLRLDEAERMTKTERRDLEKKRRDELRQILRDRQEEIQKERQKVQQEFDRNIERLYAKAVSFYKSKDYGSAQGLFYEIDQMKPGYKKTGSYLQGIKDKDPDGAAARSARRAESSVGVIAAQQLTQPVSPRLSIIQQTLDQLESGK
jgi:colicin import membrane protein